MNRRTFLAGAGSAALVVGFNAGAAASEPSVAIAAGTRVIEVNGRAATVAGLRQPSGAFGARFRAGDRFRVALTNRLSKPTLIHWHGLRAPVEQDGVPVLSQPLLQPGGLYTYDFLLRDSGTFWMHSHHGLQEQSLLAAPLIVAEAEETDEQEVVLMLHDFSFRDPEEIFASLRSSGMSHAPVDGQGGHAAHGTPSASSGHGGAMGGRPHLNDVEFDAYLANDRTLADPELVPVERGGRVRVRIINGASSTNFHIDLGALEGDLIAVDGRPVFPVRGRRFPIAMSQRLDLRLRIEGSGVFPVLAVREGDRQATGIVLHTPGASVARLPEMVLDPAPPLSFAEEEGLRARHPLAERRADRRITIALTEDPPVYSWGMGAAGSQGMRDYAVAAGERVEITFDNQTGMSHPMHLHGHLFQVVGAQDRRFPGATRDTVLVPYRGSVTIAFDADNPGAWMVHCHNLYHMVAGMMAVLRYS
ncbi:MAG TPA: multicopper oxidase family protein [Alphaproteobacteria bacterium]|nr:multicopper oxidase family protein [Alphaproteobacteria bacterium]